MISRARIRCACAAALRGDNDRMNDAIPDLIERETGPDPVASLIVLHGLGADATDFLPFVDELDLSAIGPVRFVFPNAPVRPVTINGGYRMRAWYDIVHGDLGRREDEQGLRESQHALEALLAREKARGIPAARIVLAGFSQGCAMALLTGLCHAERLGGIVGLSGYLPLAEQVRAGHSAASRDVPLFLAHGRHDDVVSLSRGQAARDLLQSLGHAVHWREYAMPHSVCMEEIADLNRWLVGTLAVPGAV